MTLVDLVAARFNWLRKYDASITQIFCIIGPQLFLCALVTTAIFAIVTFGGVPWYLLVFGAAPLLETNLARWKGSWLHRLWMALKVPVVAIGGAPLTLDPIRQLVEGVESRVFQRTSEPSARLVATTFRVLFAAAGPACWYLADAHDKHLETMNIVSVVLCGVAVWAALVHQDIKYAAHALPPIASALALSATGHPADGSLWFLFTNLAVYCFLALAERNTRALMTVTPAADALGMPPCLSLGRLEDAAQGAVVGVSRVAVRVMVVVFALPLLASNHVGFPDGLEPFAYIRMTLDSVFLAAIDELTPFSRFGGLPDGASSMATAYSALGVGMLTAVTFYALKVMRDQRRFRAAVAHWQDAAPPKRADALNDWLNAVRTLDDCWLLRSYRDEMDFLSFVSRIGSRKRQARIVAINMYDENPLMLRRLHGSVRSIAKQDRDNAVGR